MFLCFAEYKIDGTVVFAVRSFDLSELLSSSPCKGSLRVAWFVHGTDLPVHMGCGAYGNRIVIAGGVRSRYDPVKGQMRYHPCKDVWYIDTRKLGTQMEPTLQGKFQPFRSFLSSH